MQPEPTPSLVVETNIMVVFLSSCSTTETAAQKNYSIEEDTWKSWFETWLSTLYPNLPKADAYELTVRLTDDLEIQNFNQQYRHQNRPTDVLAFAALEVDIPQPSDGSIEVEPLYLGDIIISVDTANRQAQERKHSLTTELAWLASHGLLHLVGWDHPDEESLVKMLSQQENLLKVVGLFP